MIKKYVYSGIFMVMCAHIAVGDGFYGGDAMTFEDVSMSPPAEVVRMEAEPMQMATAMKVIRVPNPPAEPVSANPAVAPGNVAVARVPANVAPANVDVPPYSFTIDNATGYPIVVTLLGLCPEKCCPPGRVCVAACRMTTCVFSQGLTRAEHATLQTYFGVKRIMVEVIQSLTTSSKIVLDNQSSLSTGSFTVNECKDGYCITPN